MEFYVADDTFSILSVLENYESMVWTERYVGPGDFTLTTDNYDIFNYYLESASPYYLRKAGSQQVMMIETITKNAGEDTATITGRTLDAFFENRSGVSYGSGTAKSYTASPINIMQSIVNEYCCSAGLNQIPGLSSPSWDTSASVTMSVSLDTVLNMLTAVANAENLGWQLVTDGASSLYFTAIEGTDYSTQGSSSYVELSPNTELLTATSAVKSIANYKTEARVIGAKTVTSVYSDGSDGTYLTGWNRRTVVVQATDVGTDSTTTVAQDQAVLVARGRAALADATNAYAQTVDGTVVALPAPVLLGDIIALADGDIIGPIPARITEMVYSKDNTGEKTTPTLAMIPITY